MGNWKKRIGKNEICNKSARASASDSAQNVVNEDIKRKKLWNFQYLFKCFRISEGLRVWENIYMRLATKPTLGLWENFNHSAAALCQHEICSTTEPPVVGYPIYIYMKI